MGTMRAGAGFLFSRTVPPQISEGGSQTCSKYLQLASYIGEPCKSLFLEDLDSRECLKKIVFQEFHPSCVPF